MLYIKMSNWPIVHVTIRPLTDECYTLGCLTDQWYILLLEL